MVDRPRGTLGLWTVNGLRHGPSLRSEKTFPLSLQRPSHPVANTKCGRWRSEGVAMWQKGKALEGHCG